MLADTINGGASADILSGLGGDDTISGDAGNDNLSGGDGSDKLFGNAASNFLNGAGGADAMRGFAGNDFYIVDHAGDAIVEIAGQGIDTVMSSTSYSLAAGVSVETLKTTPRRHNGLSLSGNELVNTLEGNAGANALNGRGGADTMRGFAGNDIYYVDNALDNVIEGGGQGSDTIWTTVSYVMGSGAVVETLRAASPAATTAINLVGNAIANTLVGNDGNNILIGGAGNDTMYGLGGDDAYVVDLTARQNRRGRRQGHRQHEHLDQLSARSRRVGRDAAHRNAVGHHGDKSDRQRARQHRHRQCRLERRSTAAPATMRCTAAAATTSFVFNTALNAATNVDTISGLQRGGRHHPPGERRSSRRCRPARWRPPPSTSARRRPTRRRPHHLQTATGALIYDSTAAPPAAPTSSPSCRRARR